MSKASIIPHDAFSVEFHRGPCPLVVERDSANVDNGADETIRLFLFERGFKAVGVGITVQVERSRLVHYFVLTREDNNRRCCEFHEESANNVLNARVKSNLAPFLGRIVIGRMHRVMLCRNLR